MLRAAVLVSALGLIAVPASAQNACSVLSEREDFYACLDEQHTTIFTRNLESLARLGIPYSGQLRVCPPRENLIRWAACLTDQNRRIDGQARRIQQFTRELRR